MPRKQLDKKVLIKFIGIEDEEKEVETKLFMQMTFCFFCRTTKC